MTLGTANLDNVLRFAEILTEDEILGYRHILVAANENKIDPASFLTTFQIANTTNFPDEYLKHKDVLCKAASFIKCLKENDFQKYSTLIKTYTAVVPDFSLFKNILSDFFKSEEGGKLDTGAKYDLILWQCEYLCGLMAETDEQLEDRTLDLFDQVNEFISVHIHPSEQLIVYSLRLSQKQLLDSLIDKKGGYVNNRYVGRYLVAKKIINNINLKEMKAEILKDFPK